MGSADCSVVIPVFNERENLWCLYAHVVPILARMGTEVELVFVDDGSRDGSWEVLRSLQAKDSRVRPLRLTRNFGQTAAMKCGIDAARGEVIVTMDGDLQNDPEDIPRLLEKLEEGYDIVCGWRYRRQDNLWTRKIPSMLANRLIGWLTGVQLHDYGCSLKAYRAKAIKQTPLYAEFHRFIPALATLTGALVTEIKVTHHPRRFGQTNYTLWRTWKVAFDMVTVSLLVKFASKPLRFFGCLALCSMMVALAALARSWQWYLAASGPMPQALAGVGLLAIWLSAHLVAVGWFAELCLSTAHARPERFIIAQGR